MDTFYFGTRGQQPTGLRRNNIRFIKQYEPPAKEKSSKMNKMKHEEVEWGFSCTLDELQSLCVMCGVTFRTI
jgi:hypothetical protein